MKIENPNSMKRHAHRLGRASASETVGDELARLDLILSDLDDELANYELHIPPLDDALREARAGLDTLRAQWADERAALSRLSQSIEQLLAAAEYAEPKACIDDSFEEERESFSAAGRSQLLVSNSKTATDNKQKALQKLIDSKRNG